MKTFIIWLLFFMEFFILSVLLGFIWYLSDEGVPFKILAQNNFAFKILSILCICAGTIVPVLVIIAVGIKIDDRIKHPGKY